MPSGEAKSSILAAIARAQQRIPVTVALRVLVLSGSRDHAWLRLDQSCDLDDRSSCPRKIPNQLTRQEVTTAYDMAIAMEYRHMPIRTLALYAQRTGDRSRSQRASAMGKARTSVISAWRNCNALAPEGSESQLGRNP